MLVKMFRFPERSRENTHVYKTIFNLKFLTSVRNSTKPVLTRNCVTLIIQPRLFNSKNVDENQHF